MKSASKAPARVTSTTVKSTATKDSTAMKVSQAKDLKPKKDPKGGPVPCACWVAREVYGEENPMWQQFRTWLLGSAQPEFVEFYKANGAEIALEIASQPKTKELIRHLMDAAKR